MFYNIWIINHKIIYLFSSLPLSSISEDRVDPLGKWVDILNFSSPLNIGSVHIFWNGHGESIGASNGSIGDGYSMDPLSGANILAKRRQWIR